MGATTMAGDQKFTARGGTADMPDSQFAAAAGSKLQSMNSDAKALKDLARTGDVTIDPDGAHGIASTFEAMVDEIVFIKAGMFTAGQHPKLGTSPYAEKVANYQREAAEAFLEVVEQLEEACRTCGEAFRASATGYSERDQDAAEEIRKAGRKA
jgi:hypothetical protein